MHLPAPVTAGRARLALLGAARFAAPLAALESVTVSAWRQLGDRWAVLGSAAWQQWSRFGMVEVGRGDLSGEYADAGILSLPSSLDW